MTSPHAALFFVLLLLPGTTLRDWQSANAPHLHRLMSTGSLALMNARTAEQDKITPAAGFYTLMAGARMKATPDAHGLGYPARADNLPAALEEAGVSVYLPPYLGPHPLGGHRQALPLQGPHPPTPSPNAGGKDAVIAITPPPPGAGGVARQGRGGSAARFIAIDLGSDPAQADEAIGKWADIVRQSGGEMMVVSPNPSPAQYRADDQLTPVLLWGPSVPAETLTSVSTHQPGLVTNTDIAPTIAEYFHATLPTAPFGAPATEVAAGGADVSHALSQADSFWVQQARALAALPYIAAALALLVAIGTAYAIRGGGRSVGMIAPFVVAIPFALLFSDSLPILISLAISALGGAFALRKRPWEGVMWIGSVTALVILGDALFTAGRGTGHSLLGYSPIEGARYYGIGNEAMGALVGALVIVTGALARLPRARLVPIALWLVAAFALGWPSAGAKAGGALVAAVALATYIAALSGVSFRRPLVLAGVIASVFVFAALLALVGTKVGHTHIGQAVQLARAQGTAAIWSIASRKAGMDLHLVFHSVWALVLLVTAAGAWAFVKYRGLSRESGKAGLATGIAAAAACLTLNDAGVVAAALCCLSLWAYCASTPACETRQVEAAQPAVADPPIAGL